jgi:hypothetical protein
MGTNMSRVIAVVACGLTLAGCTSWSPNLDFMKPAPATVTMQFESEPPGAEAKTSVGQSCRTPCALSMAPDKEFAVTFALNGYQPQTVPVQMGRPEDASPIDAENRLTPNPVYVELVPGKPSAKRAPAPAKKKPAAAGTPAAAAAATPWPGAR